MTGHHRPSLFSLGYVRGLDTLRALSVSAVILGHTMPDYIHGGSLGVDIFFVLSGFLITRIVRSELERTGSLDFRAFYLRRLLRLTPALWIMITGYILACMALTFFKMGPGLWNVASASLASITYVMNWTRAYHIGSEAGLGHTWSLAIEEQFYLLWPLLLATLYRVTPQRLFATSVALCAVSFALNYVMLFSRVDYFRIYNGFDTRAGELLVGCSLGLVDLRRLPSLIFRPWPIPALILAFCLFAPQNWIAPIFELGLPLIDICAAWIIGATVVTDRGSEGLMANPAAVYIGKISYGIYLWHWPIAHAIDGLFSSAVCLIIVYASSVVLASLSYRLVECRILPMRDRWIGKPHLSP